MKKKRGGRREPPGGRPPFVPTDEQRRQVMAMAGYGITHDDIAMAMSVEGIDAKTLREHFRPELDKGLAVAKVKLAEAGFHLAVGRPAEYQGSNLLREELKPDRTMAIFLSKVRLGMIETQKLEHSGPNGGPIQTIDLDLTVFTDDEFKQFMQLYEKARRRRDDVDRGGPPAEIAA